MGPFRLARPRFLAFFVMEGALIFAVLFGLAMLTQNFMQYPGAGGARVPPVIAAGFLFSFVLLVTQWANPGDQSSLKRELVLFTIISVFAGLLYFAGLCLLVGRRWRPECFVVLAGSVVVPAAVALWRLASIRFYHGARERVLIIGTGEIAQQVCRWTCNDHASEYAVIGFVDEDDTREGTVLAMGVRIQSAYASLVEFAVPRADRVIVALDEKRGKLPVHELMRLRLHGIDIEEATTFFERISGKISVESLLPSWLIFSDGFKTSALKSLVKRAADLTLATLLLLIASPLMLAAAALILMTSGAPVIYRQSRVGLDGREFNVLKFRSMRRDAELKTGPTWAEEDDPRITTVGRIIRKLRIDELPQLINVFKGEMSFVGPRPERGHFMRQLGEKIPYYWLRTAVRPGITGWAQVEHHYGASEEDALEKLKYDLYYIKNNNLLFDLWIVLKTVKVVLPGSGAR